jgi:hypothetical protein
MIVIHTSQKLSLLILLVIYDSCSCRRQFCPPSPLSFVNSLAPRLLSHLTHVLNSVLTWVNLFPNNLVGSGKSLVAIDNGQSTFSRPCDELLEEPVNVLDKVQQGFKRLYKKAEGYKLVC